MYGKTSHRKRTATDKNIAIENVLKTHFRNIEKHQRTALVKNIEATYNGSKYLVRNERKSLLRTLESYLRESSDGILDQQDINGYVIL